ncbi:MAG: bifunctional methylenetetrahydrofolate dehydrogenase/methenyltetrahydrofolate cyclohydrolase FolD [Anaerolineaceae bacterium]|nr:bifunctional methylenetetrahydrofolate dehydrogenase/methenyltetrahydrofolate cyclohydrolase FolD [Anaerolineaceae bacterium]
MVARIIDGKAVAAKVREDVAKGVKALADAGKPVPGLATVLVGEDAGSQVYVSMKHKACSEVGINSYGYELPAETTQEELEDLVKKLNDDPKVHGILVQLPLPSHLDEERVLRTISLEKDVDGFHPMNIGRLAQKGRDPLFISATPFGVMHLLEQELDTLEGVNAVVLGRSNIVGMPVALLLVKANATVTICHSRTKDLKAKVREADVLIAAVGRTEMVKGDWIKPGAVVIDVGTNRKDDPTRKRGYRLVGDVDFEAAKEVAGAITPVPGGVGPMTIAMLLKNTLKAINYAAD